MNSGKTYVGLLNGDAFFVSPSSEHKNHWWVCKVNKFGWEGLTRPIHDKGLHFLLDSFVPKEVLWSEREWDGFDMQVPLESKKKSSCDVVYFIEAVGLDRVKIGISSGDANSRMDSLQCGCPVELRMALQIPGNSQTEKALHEKFWPYRLHREWFEFSDAIKSFIKEYEHH